MSKRNILEKILIKNFQRKIKKILNEFFQEKFMKKLIFAISYLKFFTIIERSFFFQIFHFNKFLIESI